MPLHSSAMAAPRHDEGRMALLVPALIAAVFVGFVLLGPYFSYRDAPTEGEGNALRQVVYLALLAGSFLAARNRPADKAPLAVPLSLKYLLLWCWLSLIWSIEPSIAVRRLVLTCVVIWTVFLIVDRLRFDRTVAVLQWVTSAFLLANFAAVLLAPDVGIHQMADPFDPGLVGDWRGVLVQKNFAGAVCAIAVLLFVLGGQGVNPLWRWLMVVGNLVFLWGTSSKTSMAILGVSLVAGWMFLRHDPRYRGFAILALAAIATTIAVLVQIYWAEITAPFDNQDALTGRVQIWPALFAYAQDHWLFGAGYGSFWNVGDDSPIFRYGKGWVTELGNAHSGYMDVLVQLGVIGLALTVAALLVIPLLSVIASPRVGGRRGALLVALLVFCAGHNGTETSLLERDAIVQVFLIFAIALIEAADTRAPEELEAEDYARLEPMLLPRRRQPRAIAHSPRS